MRKDKHPSFDHIRIRQIRENRNLSQVIVAQRLGISQSSYNDLEQGRTKLKAEMLPLLAESLGVDIHCFFEPMHIVTNGKNHHSDLENEILLQYRSLLQENEKLAALLCEQKQFCGIYRQRSDEQLEDMHRRLRTKRFFIKMLLLFNASIFCILVVILLIKHF